MFTDSPTTPARLEALLDVARGPRRWTAKAVAEAMQPETLPDVKETSKQAEATLSAAKELGLLVEGKEYLSATFKPGTTTREAVVAAFDARILGGGEVEPYFAAFYAFLLARDEEGARDRSRAEWVKAFVAANPWASESNPFNSDKLTGMHRWLSYAGLGWYDPRGVFQCNPYDRLARRLPAIFGKHRELPATGFFEAMAAECPELDGGAVFRRAVPPSDQRERRCTLGLAHALIELHLDGVLRLHCPGDSDGWDIGHAEPPQGGTIASYRIDRVEMPDGGRAA